MTDPVTEPSTQGLATPQAVNRFWFQEVGRRDWFRKSNRLDQRIATLFRPTLNAAAAGELAAWRADAGGRLAEILVLDQFSRNIHRDQARAFDNDSMALALARQAVTAGADRELPPARRAFVYMPYMHSESLADHEDALALYTALGLASHLKAERDHLRILERFGRYPHRNATLGRASTAAEQAFLAEPGASF